MNTVTIHSIETLGALDGPGLRTVVFLQGCPLRCRFCHNPDSWNPTAGQTMTIQQLMAKIIRMKPYYGKEGGVTFSGGEPLCQPQPLMELLENCRQQHIHTAIDTSGAIWNEHTEQLLQQANLVLLDIKGATPETFKQTTGLDAFHNLIKHLDFFKQTKHPLWIRIVVANGINDTPQDIQNIKNLIKDVPYLKLELLPYHQGARDKYAQLNLPFDDTIAPPSPQLIDTINQQLNAKQI